MVHTTSGPFSVAPGEVHVVWARVGEAPPGVDREPLAALLSAVERERLERFAFEEDRWRYLVAHGLLRRALSRCAPVSAAEWRFVATAAGRPEIEAPAAARRLRFSLSHAAGVTACAVCLDHAVGLDVEAVDASLMAGGVEQRILSAAEQEELAPLSGAARLRRLFALWTLKEACLKARGDGLAVEPAQLSFFWPRSGPPVVTFEPATGEHPDQWRLESCSLPTGHALAVAVRCPAAIDLRVLPLIEDRSLLS
jgi:4'-phosphopantetheinyl transferase